ncbi:MAG: ribokinase [Solirubrobacteraceae bacterium]
MASQKQRAASMPGSVAVVGSLNLDVTLTVQRLPSPGETLVAQRSVRGSGGKGANQAAAAAAAGAQVTMIGAVGDDPAGTTMLADLRSLGVDVGRVRTVAGTFSGAATILLDAARGENMIIVEPGANASLDVSDVRVPAIRDAAVLLTQLETPAQTVKAAVLEATGMVVLNAAPYRALEAELLARVDVLVCNQTELGEMTGLPTPETLADVRTALRALAPQHAVIVTVGEQGAVVYQPEQAPADPFTTLAAPAVTPVDTTGAGDCFCGVLATWLADGATLLEAARAAVIAGTRSTLAGGARGVLVDRASIMRELEAVQT